MNGTAARTPGRRLARRAAASLGRRGRRGQAPHGWRHAQAGRDRARRPARADRHGRGAARDARPARARRSRRPEDLRAARRRPGPAARAARAQTRPRSSPYLVANAAIAQALSDQFTLHSVPARDGAPAQPLLGLAAAGGSAAACWVRCRATSRRSSPWSSTAARPPRSTCTRRGICRWRPRPTTWASCTACGSRCASAKRCRAAAAATCIRSGSSQSSHHATQHSATTIAPHGSESSPLKSVSPGFTRGRASAIRPYPLVADPRERAALSLIHAIRFRIHRLIPMAGCRASVPSAEVLAEAAHRVAARYPGLYGHQRAGHHLPARPPARHPGRRHGPGQVPPGDRRAARGRPDGNLSRSSARPSVKLNWRREIQPDRARRRRRT